MRFLIIGGDNRFKSLKETLILNNFETESMFLNENDKIQDITNFDIVVLPIPFIKNNILNAPFYSKEINTNTIFSLLNEFKGKIIGGFDKHSKNLLLKKGLDIVNILEDEEFTLINAIITAEGTIQKLINESELSLFELNISIIGYGRVSKALSRRLYPLCKSLIIYNNPSINYIYTKIDSIPSKEIYDFKNDAKNFNIIINTVPHLIINKDIIDLLNNDTLILDLASLPGGVDFKYSKEKNIKTIHYLGIPGKISPKSASNAIFNFIKKFL